MAIYLGNRKPSYQAHNRQYQQRHLQARNGTQNHATRKKPIRPSQIR